jgi:hypothetical protein
VYFDRVKERQRLLGVVEDMCGTIERRVGLREMHTQTHTHTCTGTGTGTGVVEVGEEEGEVVVVEE